jgi:hypothetical protein
LEVAPPVDGGVIANDKGEVSTTPSTLRRIAADCGGLRLMSADCAPPQVTALWTSCAYQKGNHNSQIFRGVPVHHLAEATAHLRKGVQPPRWRTLGAMLEERYEVARQ